MKRAFKAILIFVNILLSIITLSLVRLIFRHSLPKRILYASYINHIFNKFFTFILGIRVNICGEKGILKKRGVFFVSNHLSYIDGITASALSPIVFIGRSDLKRWPLFGLLATLSYTIFVDRVSPANIDKEISKIDFFLNHGINVILFPEGTSTDGSKQLSFKSSFFTAAVHTECPVVPLVIKYKKINGQPVNDVNKDFVYWYGDMDFIPHLFKALGLERIEMELTVCKPLDVLGLEDKIPSFKRKYLSGLSQEIISNHLLQRGNNLDGNPIIA